MQKLLVPLDLSQCSINGLEYASKLAEKINASITVWHVHDQKHNTLKKDLEAHLEKIKEQYSVEYHIKYKAGDYIKRTADLLLNEHFDLVVMGSKGSSGLEKYFRGSLTSKLVEQIIKPVIIVPENWNSADIKKIFWASDFDSDYANNSLKPISVLAQAFGAEVRIGHINTERGIPDYDTHLEMSREKHYFESKNIHHSFKQIFRSSVKKGINYYLDVKGDNDLLVFIKREHSLIDKLFGLDTTYEFINQPELPILVIHE